ILRPPAPHAAVPGVLLLPGYSFARTTQGYGRPQGRAVVYHRQKRVVAITPAPELSRGRSVFANVASPGLSRPPARRRRGGPRRVTQLCLRTAAPPDAQNDQGLSEGPPLGADRRRPPERRHPPAAHGPATGRRNRPRLLPLGGPADSPRAARPDQALLRAAGRRRASRLARRG